MSPKKDNINPKISGRLKDLIHRYEDSKVAKEIEDNFKLSSIHDYDPNTLQLYRLYDKNLYDLESLSNLNEEIKKDGQLFPSYLFRNPADGQLFVFSGIKRYLLALANNKPLKAAVIENIDDIKVSFYSLEQILQNKDNPLILSKAYKEIKDIFNISYEELAKLVDSSKSQVINYIKLLDLPIIVKEAIIQGQLSYGEARPLNGLKTEQDKIEIFNLIKNGQFSAREIEELVRLKKNPDLRSLRRVTLVDNRIIIKCSSKEEALELLEKVRKL